MKKKELIIVAILLASIVVWTIPTSALTYQTTTDVEFTVNPSINVSLSSNDLLISDLTPGTSSDSNIITVDVSTNAGYGYYLAATAGTSSGSTNLVNTVDSSRVFTNLSSNKASLANFSDNTWGYSYSTDNGTSWISGNNDTATAGYNGLPLDNNDNGATGIKLASTDSYVSTNSIKFKIGAKASTTQSGGTYTNTVNFYAVANPEPQLGPVACEASKICYNTNVLSSTEVVGTMGRQTAGNDGDTVTLLASNYSRQGYGFAGWSDTYDYTGNLYGPQEDITVPTGTATSGLSLYAIWIPSAGSMQSDVTSICGGLTAATSATKTLNSVSALTDQRDNQTYAVAKLADNNCWMIENLRLENTNSDNSAGHLARGYGKSDSYGDFSGLANPESPWSNSEASNSLYSTSTNGNKVVIGTSEAMYRFPRYNHENTFSRDSDIVDNYGAVYSYGNYYTWPVAIADTAMYYNDGHHGENSICPSGWRLPLGGYSSGDIEQGESDNNNNAPGFSYLDRRMGGNGGSQSTIVADLRWRSFPINAIYSGLVMDGRIDNRGEYGYLWGDSSVAAASASVFDITWQAIHPDNIRYKYHGLSIRCVED